MNQPVVAYTKGTHHADATIVQNADGRFQGAVHLTHGGESGSSHHHLVPVASDTPEEALDEAKALAHRLLSDLQ